VNPCPAWTFDGWYGSTYAKSTTKPTYITQMTSTGTAYAVYKHTDESGSGSSDVDFIFADIASSESWGSETDGHNDITISPVNISVSKGSASYCGRWWSDNTWRIYSGNKITITTTSGEITAVTSSPSRTFTIADGKATLTTSSRIDFKSITVTYSTTSTTYYSTTAECLEKVQTPTFDVAGGSYTAAQSVTISSATTGATIYYTLDGTDPTTSSTLYTGAVTIPKGAQTTLKAIATKSGMANSDIASATYDIRVYDIVLSRSGVTENIANVVHGTTIASIAGSGDQGGCSDYPFAGWSATPVADNSSSYTAASTITAAGTYYAVYSHTTTGSGAAASVTFEDASGDSSDEQTTDSDIKANLVDSYTGITSFSASKAYLGADGLKLGSSGSRGSITLNLSSPVTTDKITVEASQYGSDGGQLKVEVNGSTAFGENISPSTGTCVFDNGSSVIINSVTVSTTSKRAYISSISLGTSSTTVYSSNSGCCDDVPHDITVIPSLKSAKILWSATAATATVRVYSDAECSSMVDEKTGVSSPVTFDGLSEETTYYAKVWAGGTCASAAVSFTTLTASVEIAEWFPDSIRINLEADENTATVLIEDKQEKSTSTTTIADGLFFSKYYEAYKNIKLWAIYNGTANKISLANVKVKSSNNGSDWGKQSGSSADDNQRITSLAAMGHHETGYIYPGEEIIVYNDGSDSDDAAIISCMESTYGTAYKTDPDSIWYLVENNTTAISGDDGLLLLDGTDTLDVIGGLDAEAAYLAADEKPEWGDAVGWNCDDGEDVNGNTIGLSTNRCLLVRKNTVKDGLNAVAKNKTTFTTLCEEWWGAHVPKDGDQRQVSCDNFSYVGHYDYNKYYATYDSITTVDELPSKKNEDGTYTVAIPQLDTLSCSMLRIKVSEGGVEKVSQEYKVPIMVEAGGTVKTNDAIFKKHEVPTCKECDVVILKDAVLEKTNGADDRDEVRNLTIYPGGTLVVPEGKGDYTVQSVRFRVEDEKAPAAKLKGNLITKDEQVTVTRRINNDRYYFFSLPYDCNIADIRWSNGQTPVRGVDYQIVEYDGQNRAIEGSGSGVGAHWKPVSGTQLKAGKGYNIAVSTKYLRELVFPMAINTTDLTAKENGKANTVAIHQYDGTSTINNHNWNLVAHPYVSAFSAYEGSTIEAGWLKYTEPANPGDKGTWSYESETSVYLTMPSFQADKITYTQTLSTDISSLDPFLAVFVQGASEGDLTFAQSGRKLTAPARHLAAKAENEDESIFVGVTLSGNEQSDQTNVRIRPDFTEDYQLGYDLEKFITFYTPRPQVYMKTPENRLAFQAVSDDVAKSSWMPMGVYCYEAGTYTFALSDHYPTDEVEAVYLQDKTAGITTNLLYDTYSITTTKQLYTNTRFALNVIVRRKTPQITTGTEQIVETEAPRKILINGHVFIQRGGVLYDITGKQMLNH
jgi:hypothetical protein